MTTKIIVRAEENSVVALPYHYNEAGQKISDDLKGAVTVKPGQEREFHIHSGYGIEVLEWADFHKIAGNRAVLAKSRAAKAEKFSQEEDDKIREHQRLLDDGLSDAEARDLVWPDAQGVLDECAATARRGFDKGIEKAVGEIFSEPSGIKGAGVFGKF